MIFNSELTTAASPAQTYYAIAKKTILNINMSQSWRRGTKCDCKTDWLWVRSPLEEMKYLFKFIFPFHFSIYFSLWCRGAALGSATQHAMPPEFGRKWGT